MCRDAQCYVDIIGLSGSIYKFKKKIITKLLRITDGNDTLKETYRPKYISRENGNKSGNFPKFSL